jgi:hypothetical protein
MNIAGAMIMLSTAATVTAVGGLATRPEPLHLDVASATICQGVLDIAVDQETPTRRRVWTFRMDDGALAAQRQDPSGRWVTVRATSGGEGHLRVNAAHYGIVPLSLIRVTHPDPSGHGPDWISGPEPVTKVQECLR